MGGWSRQCLARSPALAVHQAASDTTPPEVMAAHPPDGAVGQPVTSRIGFSFSDQVDLRSFVAGSTVIVRAVGGGAALTGHWGQAATCVNFWPDAPLAADTAYEVVLPAGESVCPVCQGRVEVAPPPAEPDAPDDHDDLDAGDWPTDPAPAPCPRCPEARADGSRVNHGFKQGLDLASFKRHLGEVLGISLDGLETSLPEVTAEAFVAAGGGPGSKKGKGAKVAAAKKTVTADVSKAKKAVKKAVSKAKKKLSAAKENASAEAAALRRKLGKKAPAKKAVAKKAATGSIPGSIIPNGRTWRPWWDR